MRREWEREPLRALMVGRERAVERGMPPPAPAIEETPRRERIGSPIRERTGSGAPDPPPPFRPSPVQAWRRLLSSRHSLRQAIVLREVLGPPTSLRRE